MRIAIDARFLGPEGTGIGKYTEKLLENLQILDSENEYKVLLRRNNFSLFKPKSKNFEKILADSHWYTLKEQMLIPVVLTKLKPDLVHFLHFNVPLLYPGKFVVTVHDIIKSEFKSMVSTTHRKPIFLFRHAGYEFVLRLALERSEKIIVPSNFVKNKLINNFNTEPKNVKVIYEATDEAYLKEGKTKVSDSRKTELLKKYKIEGPFIIYVGNAYEYKNLVVVFQSLELLDGSISFVHVTSRNFFVDKLVNMAKEIGVEDRYIVTGFVTNQELADLYKISECLVSTSLSEGFGLPGLEAMAVGCPVICSDIEVFREVYGDAALYFDPKNNLELANKIESIIQNDKLKDEQVKKGLKQVKKYSWRNTAEQTLKVYNSLDY